jgi:hypothetical protein
VKFTAYVLEVFPPKDSSFYVLGEFDRFELAVAAIRRSQRARVRPDIPVAYFVEECPETAGGAAASEGS